MKTDAEKLALAESAIRHVLNALRDDPEKYWLMGYGTGSWEKLTEAAATLWDVEQAEVSRDFQPDKHRHASFCEQRKRDKALLEYCAENGITIRRVGGMPTFITLPKP